MAIEIKLTATFKGLHTPRTCSLRTVGVVLYSSPDIDWNDQEDVEGWEYLLPYDNVSDDDLSGV